MVRMVNSGTEATMSALRVARGFTGRDRIIKFIGCYHGAVDSLLVQAGSGMATLSLPDSPGVTKGTSADTILARYNDLDHVREIMAAGGEQVAAIILEPVAGNMGVVPPAVGFLEGLRQLASEYGSVLIFDEVMSGFRVAYGGAQERFGVAPDLTCLGTIATCQNRVGSMMTLFFTAGPVTDFGSAKASDTGRYAEYFKHMLENGVYLAPSQFEAAFVSLAHNEDNLARTAASAAAFLRG